jgi:hypothetical protein
MPNQTLAANKAADAVVAEEQSATARLQKDTRSEAKSSRADTAPAAARAAAPTAAPAIASAAAPMSASVAAPVSAAVAPALIAQPGTDLSGLDSWTAMRVQMQGRLITLDRAQAQKLFAGMVRLVRQMGQMPAAPRTPPGAPATEPVLRLTVVSQGQTLAVLVLWDAAGQWQRPAKDDVTGSVSAADVQALLQLARQSMGADAPD